MEGERGREGGGKRTSAAVGRLRGDAPSITTLWNTEEWAELGGIMNGQGFNKLSHTQQRCHLHQSLIL